MTGKIRGADQYFYKAKFEICPFIFKFFIFKRQYLYNKIKFVMFLSKVESKKNTPSF
jgi:hypothetical protein